MKTFRKVIIALNIIIILGMITFTLVIMNYRSEEHTKHINELYRNDQRLQKFIDELIGHKKESEVTNDI